MTGGRIILIHTESVSTRGGEKFLFEITRRVSASLPVVVYLERISPYWMKRYRRQGIEIRLLFRPKRFYWLLLPVSLIINIITLKKFVRKDDVVVATNFPTNLLAVVVSKRTVIHCFEPLAIFYDPVRISSLPRFSSVCVKLSRTAYSWLDRFAVRSAHTLTTLNASVSPHITSVYGRHPDSYIPNGIDHRFFSPRKKSAILQDRTTRPFYIGHSTDYTVFKGTTRFLYGIAQCRTMGVEDVRAVISESMRIPKEHKRYQELIARLGISHMVVFKGNIPEKDMPAFYRSLDAYCYTGAPECAGGSTASLSVLEAQSCGIPVIRSVGYDEEVAPKSGVIIDPSDSEAIATAILFMKSLPGSNIIRAKTNARAYVQNTFSWEKSSQKLLRVIRNILMERSV